MICINFLSYFSFSFRDIYNFKAWSLFCFLFSFRHYVSTHFCAICISLIFEWRFLWSNLCQGFALLSLAKESLFSNWNGIISFILTDICSKSKDLVMGAPSQLLNCCLMIIALYRSSFSCLFIHTIFSCRYCILERGSLTRNSFYFF